MNKTTKITSAVMRFTPPDTVIITSGNRLSAENVSPVPRPVKAWRDTVCGVGVHGHPTYPITEGVGWGGWRQKEVPQPLPRTLSRKFELLTQTTCISEYPVPCGFELPGDSVQSKPGRDHPALLVLGSLSPPVHTWASSGSPKTAHAHAHAHTCMRTHTLSLH